MMNLCNDCTKKNNIRHSSLQSNQIVNNTCLCLYCIVAVKRCCDCSELTRPCESILWNVSLLTREELPKEVTIHCFGSTLISAESNLTQKWHSIRSQSNSEIRVKVTRMELTPSCRLSESN